MTVYGKQKPQSRRTVNAKKIQTATQTRRKISSKQGILGADYYKPIDSALIRNAVDQHLDAIANTCLVLEKESITAKINHVANHLSQLQQEVQSYMREPYIEERDAIYLNEIAYIVFRGLSTLIDKQNIQGVRNAESMLIHNYRVYYNVPETKTIDEFQAGWIKKMHTGFKCLASQ